MDCIFCTLPQPVHVRGYIRYRFGRFEFVRQHCRRCPS